jgi:hypothetical protein
MAKRPVHARVLGESDHDIVGTEASRDCLISNVLEETPLLFVGSA